MNDVLKQEFEELKKDLITAYNQKGMRASGNFEQQLEVKEGNFKIELLGVDYGQQLELGRRGGKFPPINAIKQWIEDKGIASRLNGEITTSQLAFLIASKIAREGWNREGYGGVELISSVITAERMQKIIDKVGEKVTLQYTTEIIKMTKELAI